MKKFKTGDVVRSGTTTILVTGAGDKSVGYPCFSGVVLKENGDDEIGWCVGYYSKTWVTSVFKKIEIDLKAIIPG